jgi:hypothetical protein
LLHELDHKAFIQLIADRLTDSVPWKDGTNWSSDTQDALADLANKTIAEELPRVWLAGSLLALGDRLERNDCFDHAPELELVYHLRNGIAHGNRFEIHNRKRLERYPAHNRDAWFKHTIFENSFTQHKAERKRDSGITVPSENSGFSTPAGRQRFPRT